MSIKVIIAAAGSGRRMGRETPKPYLSLAGQPLILHTLMKFQNSEIVDDIVLVVRENELTRVKDEIITGYHLTKVTQVIEGGQERQDSVACGLKQIWDVNVNNDHDIVMVHDGARPFVSEDMIRECVNGVQDCGACIMGLKITDTIKKVGDENIITDTIPKKELWIAQTPQCFRLSLLREAVLCAERDGFYGTDEAALVERLPHPVRVIPGSFWNIKITYPGDVRIAEKILKMGILS